MRSLPVIITALLVGIVGTILVLGFMGIVPIFGPKADKGPVAGPGEKLVPISIADIPAYTQVSRDHLFSAKVMRFVEVPVKVSEMPDDTIYDRKGILGRVLAKPKKPFTSFEESDFLPEGTTAGISGAIEPGKRAIVAPADRIQGVQGLVQGDRFDLLMALPGGTRVQEVNSLIVGPGATTRATTSDTVIVVNNGQVISGVTERQEEHEEMGGIIGHQKHSEHRTVREISLAVDPDEVVMLTKALSSGQDLIAVVRSGRPGAEKNDVDIRIPSAAAAVPVAPPAPAATPAPFVIEELRGSSRSSASFQ